MIVRECVEKQFEGSLKNKKFILNMNACDIWNIYLTVTVMIYLSHIIMQ